MKSIILVLTLSAFLAACSAPRPMPTVTAPESGNEVPAVIETVDPEKEQPQEKSTMETVVYGVAAGAVLVFLVALEVGTAMLIDSIGR